jgi:hypothetical protein
MPPPLAPVAPSPTGGIIPPSSAAPAAPPKLDPTIVNLAKAIRETETRGAKDPYTAKGGSGEFGAYQYTPATWDADVKTYAGKSVPLDQADKLLQNEVAYKKLEALKGQGYNVGQIASIWNSGSPEWQGKTGTNKFGVKYDVPQYVDTVSKAYQALKAGQTPTYGDTASTVQPPAPVPTADQASAEQSGAWFPAATGDNPLIAGLKAAGNTLPSAFNFAKGALSALNPLNTLKTLGAIPGAFSAAVDANGGSIGAALKNTATSLSGEAYTALVPKAARELVAGDVSGAARDVTNDPFGSVAPLVLGARGIAGAVDSATGAYAKTNMADYVKNLEENTKAGVPIPKGGTNLGGAIDTGIEKTAGAVTKPIGYAFGKTGDVLGGAAKLGVAKATGLNESTIDEVKANPDVFTPEKIASATRTTLGEEVGTALNDRIDSLSETGRSYKGIRADTTPVRVDPAFLGDALTKNTGLKLVKGKFVADAKSAVDSPSDIAKVQRLYDAWQPYFKKGSMTADDILTFRSKLADISNFDQGMGKSKPLDGAAKGVRASLNTDYRGQIKDLEARDAEYTSQSTELKTLRKGLIDKDGNLTDTAINRIANAAGKGKDAQLARLEEISPGITLKIRQLKAIEDIQNLHKVGTYTKSVVEGGGLVGGLATMNIPLIVGSIVAIILTQPEVAVRMIRGYGKFSGTIAGKVIEKLKQGGAAVNNLPTSRESVLNTSVFGRQPQLAPAQ